MKDYQILIDHAWSLNLDVFGIFRKYFQYYLDNRRPYLSEFKNKIQKKWGYSHPSETINYLFDHAGRDGRSKLSAIRVLLPIKISRNKIPLHPSCNWITPIDSIHT